MSRQSSHHHHHNNNNQNNRFKVVIVGDGAVGKTCLLLSFTDNEFDENHVPTVVDNKIQRVKYNDEFIDLNLWDTAGQEEFENLRLLAYPDTNLFLVCFSVVNPDSLDNIKTLWLKEIKEKGEAMKRAHCLLVGTKSDLRNDEKTLHDLKLLGKEVVTKERAEKFAKEFGFYSYVECSALTREGVNEVVMTGIDACLKGKPGVHVENTNSNVDGSVTNDGTNQLVGMFALFFGMIKSCNIL
ncbi:hypothetical protein ABK040_008090 [Willaertia magna]